VQTWPHIKDPDAVELVIAWNAPIQVWSTFKNLKLISSLGAGVDHLMKDETLPQVPIVRVVDPNLTIHMSNYVIMAILNHQRNFNYYLDQQKQRTWKPILQAPQSLNIGVLGLGVLGGALAQRLVQLGYGVAGYSTTKKTISQVDTFRGELGLNQMMKGIDVLVNLLPLTPNTEGLLAMDLFSKASKPFYLINVARGKHLIETDLIKALDQGLLNGACLDVFEKEPLPSSSPLWSHPKITVTPHIASVTDPRSALAQILDNYERQRQNRPLINQVDRAKGY
jgi:glyoxylate/hydroxypyruvate reductase A